ncbi:hypothetical protein H4Q26_015574 [Puccinia striiformis f. sp. tritici PST-130]|nr:hypothetical protein H4Q26_015574 [Puccinia striiformis f. sp. tritici PST-130]
MFNPDSFIKFKTEYKHHVETQAKQAQKHKELIEGIRSSCNFTKQPAIIARRIDQLEKNAVDLGSSCAQVSRTAGDLLESSYQQMQDSHASLFVSAAVHPVNTIQGTPLTVSTALALLQQDFQPAESSIAADRGLVWDTQKKDAISRLVMECIPPSHSFRERHLTTEDANPTFVNQEQVYEGFVDQGQKAIQSHTIPTPSSVPQTLDSIPQIIGPAYNSYRTARVASFDPYPTSQASQAAAKQSKAPALPKPPANKGVLPAINPPAEIAVPCGFEMWSNGGWTPKQKVQPVIDYVNWAYADAYTELQRELCEKFCGKVELVTKPNEDLT